jgi:hypothetical protein
MHDRMIACLFWGSGFSIPVDRVFGAKGQAGILPFPAFLVDQWLAGL